MIFYKILILFLSSDGDFLGFPSELCRSSSQKKGPISRSPSVKPIKH